jgi:hypothetical protein
MISTAGAPLKLELLTMFSSGVENVAVIPAILVEMKAGHKSTKVALETFRNSACSRLTFAHKLADTPEGDSSR